jgi:hypothetical protein
MTAASTVQGLAVCLRLPNYSVVALRPELGCFASELREALAQGVLVSARKNGATSMMSNWLAAVSISMSTRRSE